MEENKESMIASLESSIGSLFEDLQTVVSDLRSGTYDRKENDAAEMVASLGALADKYESMKASGRWRVDQWESVRC